MAKQEPEQQPGMDASPEEQASMVHLGKMMGDPRDQFDRDVEGHLAKLYPHEAGYEKMRSAQEGGQDLGPSDIDKEEVQQQQGQAKAQAAQGAQQASQAQAQQTPVNAPPAPTGPAGVSTPYPAQNAPQPPPSTQDTEPSVPGMQSPASEVGQSQQPQNGD
jgi:hypothetical protein